MKKLYMLLVLLPFLGMGQTSSKNYVKTTVFKDSVTNPTSSTDNKNVQVTYLDGLGRPVQELAGKASPNQKDIIIYTDYDKLGRPYRKYLPYESPLIGGILGDYNYDDNAHSNVLGYYNTAAYDNTTNPYAEEFYEESPLNRVIKQGAPGTAWQGTAGSTTDKTLKVSYLLNSETGDAVKRLSAITTYNSSTGAYEPSFSSSGVYKDGELNKTVTKNENWVSGNANTTIEFKDFEGRLILRRDYSAATTKHDTYYVYDVYGNLTYVLPPLANGSGSQTVLDKLCYQYKYDIDNRLIAKKLPAKGWEYMVYDDRNRVILTGPALNPFGGSTGGAEGWIYNYYDKYNRPAMSVWYPATVNATARKSLQNGLMNTSGNLADAISPSVSRENNTMNNISIDYRPGYVPTGAQLLTVNYYDDYAFPGVTALPGGVYDEQTRVNGNVLPKGMPTGSFSRIFYPTTITNGIGSTSYMIYNYDGEVVYTKTQNTYLGSTDVVEMDLDYVGKLVETKSVHTKSGKPSITVYDYYTYDHADRPLQHTQKINNNPTQLIASNNYNEIGMLERKDVGGLQKIDYTYNARGWLKGINNESGNNASITLGAGDLWGFQINYENPTDPNKKLYNGNISQTLWKSTSVNTTGNTVSSSYLYTYDGINRLKSAVDNTGNYTEYMTYDLNGNIVNLSRRGAVVSNPVNNTSGHFGNMDILSYAYNGNQLIKVTDTGSSSYGFKQGTTSEAYSYDDYGNLEKDLNKGIGTTQANEIVYNHLNLPVQLKFANGNAVYYTYDSAGTKLDKRVVSSGVSTTTQYDNGYVYEKVGGNALNIEYLPHEEGYVNIGPETSGAYQTFDYIYQYKDHLGNTRLTYKGDGYENIFSGNLTAGRDGTVVGGFEPYNGGVLSSGGTNGMAVTATNAYEGTTRFITSDFAAGSIFNMTLTGSNNGNTVRISVMEMDSNGNSNQQVLGYLGYNQSVILNFTAIGQYPNLYIVVEKDPASSGIGTPTSFYLSYFSVSKEKAGIIQENNYYAFGLEHVGYNNTVNSGGNAKAQLKRYNGKELQNELNLDYYDFGARNYDPAIGRWMNIDPLAEQSRRWTPYNYAYNNPVYFIDPDGKQAVNGSFVSELMAEVAGVDGIEWNPAGKRMRSALDAHNDAHNDAQENTNVSEGDCCGGYIAASKLKDTPKQNEYYRKNRGLKKIVDQAAWHAGVLATKVSNPHRFGGDNLGYSGAIRHAYWMYLLGVELGVAEAAYVGYLHEDFIITEGPRTGQQNLTTPDSIMDQANNAWGIAMASKNPNLDYLQFEELFLNDARNPNSLLIIPSKETIPNISLREIYEIRAKQYEQAKEELRATEHLRVPTIKW